MNLIKKYKITPDALLDQSFMLDKIFLKKIVDSCQIKPGETVLEIGAGMGTLTKELAKTGASITAVEIDARLQKALKHELRGTDVKIVQGNALTYIRKNEFDKIVSNTPYAICEPLVHSLTRMRFREAYLSVPKKFGYRLLENQGIGMFVQIFFDVEILFQVPKNVFEPAPNVNTVFIRIKPKTKEYYKNNPGDFVLKELLLQKTKKLRNGLMEAIINKEALLGNKITKKQSKETIKNMNLNIKLLDQKINSINLKGLADINKHNKKSK